MCLILKIILLVFLRFCIVDVDAYSCKSADGLDVDWFYVYKLPDLESSRDPSHGTKILYVDSEAINKSWKVSSNNADSASSSIGRTISQVFAAKQAKKDFFALYNDEDPHTNRTTSSKGHMKGVLIFNDFEGFWLIHSVPLFPSTQKGKYFYPESGKRNGQTFLCVTLKAHDLDNIGIQLQFSQPGVYEKQLPSFYEKLYPNLVLALKGKPLPRKTTQYFSVQNIISKNNQQFINFSKHKKFGKDLYADLVAPYLNSSLYVETWLNGPNDLPSNCSMAFQVYNLRSIRPLTYSFKSSKDHSKWAVSTEVHDSWICIGDINRQKSQEGRGGGTMCLKNVGISTLFRLAVGDVECCKISKNKIINNDSKSLLQLSDLTDTNSKKTCVVYAKQKSKNIFEQVKTFIFDTIFQHFLF